MIKYESITFCGNNYLKPYNLAINRNNIKRTMHLKAEKDVDHWQNKILDLANKGILPNDAKSLTHYLMGVADGWVRP